MNRLPHKPGEEHETFVPDELIDARPFAYTPPTVTMSRMESIRRMMEIENIYETLPQIDCGSCGAPTCRCFAEDVVRGEASIDDCVVLMREHLKTLLNKNVNS